MSRKQIVVENLTRHTTREVAQIVRWVAREMEVNHSSVCVRVKNGQWGGARFYANATLHSGWVWDYNRHEWKEIRVKAPRGCVHLITVKLPSSYPYPLYYYDRAETPPETSCESWQEKLVASTAHELQHYRQWKQRSRRASGRRRHQLVETECDFAAYRLLTRWRNRG